MVWDPATSQTIEAASPDSGIIIGSYSGYATHTIFEVWRVGNVSDTARST